MRAWLRCRHRRQLLPPLLPPPPLLSLSDPVCCTPPSPTQPQTLGHSPPQLPGWVGCPGKGPEPGPSLDTPPIPLTTLAPSPDTPLAPLQNPPPPPAALLLPVPPPDGVNHTQVRLSVPPVMVYVTRRCASLPPPPDGVNLTQVRLSVPPPDGVCHAGTPLWPHATWTGGGQAGPTRTAHRSSGCKLPPGLLPPVRHCCPTCRRALCGCTGCCLTASTWSSTARCRHAPSGT